MALQPLQASKLAAVSIIPQADAAIDWDNTSQEDWAEYITNPVENEGLIKFKENEHPTKIICNFDFDGKKAAVIQNNVMGSVDIETKTPTMTRGDWAYTVVKYSVKAVQHPEGHSGLKLTFHGSGYLDKDTMSELHKYGLIDQIFSTYVSMVEAKKIGGMKKN